MPSGTAEQSRFANFDSLLWVESESLPLHLLLCRVFVVREGKGYYDEQGRQPLDSCTAAVRRGLLSQGSHVAPSSQRCILCKRHETELTYCPIYGFKSSVFFTKDLTPALF